MTYPEALDWLYATQQFGIKLGLEQPRRLLRETGGFPNARTQVIHVAGTNGKGSTCAMIDALARACGTRTGLFTSPHLIDYRERIKVNGQDIPEKITAQYLTDLQTTCSNKSDWPDHPTFFELTLAVAMRHFREQQCDLIILETGMGGRLDATTAVPANLAVITPIALDHSQWLGDTLSAIAEEKAGIILPNTPVISSAQEPAARGMIEQRASELHAPIKWITAPLAGYHVNIPGPHQKHNAAVAVEAAHQIKLPINYDIVQHALSTVTWPGRFEKVTHPHSSSPLILDATHNPHAAHALVQTWKEEYPNQKAHVIFGAVEGKNTEEVLSIITPITSHFHFVPTNSPRSLSTEELTTALPENVQPHTQHNNLSAALDATQNSNTPTLITGSLFLIGQAKANLAGKKTRGSSQ